MVLIAAGALLEGAGLLLLAPLVSLLLNEDAASVGISSRLVQLIPGHDPGERLMLLIAAFATLAITRAGVLIARDVCLARLQHGFVESLRLRLIERLATASWQRVARMPRARVVQVLGAEMQQVGVAAYFLLHGAVACAMLIVHGALALVLAPAAAIAAFALLIPAALIGWRVIPSVRRLGSAVIVDHHRMTDHMIRFLESLKAAAAHNLQSSIIADHRRISDSVLANRRAFFGLQATSRHAASTMVALAGAAAVLLGALVLHRDAAVLIVLVLVLSRAGAPALLLQQSAHQIAHCLPAFGAVRALEAECGSPRHSRPGTVAMPAGPSLGFECVTFLHPAADGTSAGGVRCVSTTIPAGAVIGIGGSSGAGKTSFVDLAAGLLTPTEGTILVNEAPIVRDALGPYLDRIGYAGREPVLFGDTIRANLSWGGSACPDSDLWHALADVGAAELVEARGGLDAPVEERGSAFSAGEGQRLALARLLLRKPALIILDEATASLDVASERRILQALRTSADRPTILIVSHRAETFRSCDAVLRFESGSLVRPAEPFALAQASTA